MTAWQLLMCDDDAAVGDFVRRVAEDVGYHVHFTADADDFAPLYRRLRPDVVILDLVMPGIDGIELLRFLAAERSRARVLLMSGFDPGLRDAAMLLGEAHSLDMVGIIPKPVRAADLRHTLASLQAVKGA